MAVQPVFLDPHLARVPRGETILHLGRHETRVFVAHPDPRTSVERDRVRCHSASRAHSPVPQMLHASEKAQAALWS